MNSNFNNPNVSYIAGRQYSRNKLNTYRLVLFTSLFWVFIDGLIILYLTDSYYINNSTSYTPCNSNIKNIMNESIYKKDSIGVLGKREDDEFHFKLLAKNISNHIKNDSPKTTIGIMKPAVQEVIIQTDVESNLDEQDDDSAEVEINSENEYDKWFVDDHSNDPTNPPDWPGENGEGVAVPEALKGLSRKRFLENQFDIVASELIALNRSLTDFRSDQ